MSDIIADRAKFERGWSGGLPETPCGYGSKMSTTELQREWIPEVITRYGIETICDVGAGDLNWLQHMDLRGAHYLGLDLVPRHERVNRFDLLEEQPPQSDLILCLWVLNHLPYAASELALSNLLTSGSKYLMMTDRPKWHAEQPPLIAELAKHSIESIIVERVKRDAIHLIDIVAAVAAAAGDVGEEVVFTDRKRKRK